MCFSFFLFSFSTAAYPVAGTYTRQQNCSLRNTTLFFFSTITTRANGQLFSPRNGARRAGKGLPFFPHFFFPLGQRADKMAGRFWGGWLREWRLVDTQLAHAPGI
ncbi:hypothetical protein BU16DRAFT_246422 [Lophium mytilinum]|uniref:Secreted protein n=1 Tax=Lophium mytilinum TaxID=390894 RepID=A0A6A6R6M8_9PEZI|nr:hypothetical protein BU16DRAFT_246422 [Lophium mytilinum]